MSFDSLGLRAELLRAVTEAGVSISAVDCVPRVANQGNSTVSALKAREKPQMSIKISKNRSFLNMGNSSFLFNSSYVKESGRVTASALCSYDDYLRKKNR